jgi:SPP1 family predicted phage head-tail adaptor
MTLGATAVSDAGQLDHPIEWFGATAVTDEYGSVTLVWASLGMDWAEVLPLRTSERLQAQQEQGVIDYMLRVRWRDDVTEERRIAFDGDTYDVVGPPVERGRHQYLEVLIRRRAPGQPEGSPASVGSG